MHNINSFCVINEFRMHRFYKTKFFKMLQNNELNILAEELVTNNSKHLLYIFVAYDKFFLRSDLMKPLKQANLSTPKKQKKNIITIMVYDLEK